MIKPCYGCGKHPKECRCEVRDDFVVRCLRLERNFNNLRAAEGSSRVWITVTVEIIKRIIKEQDDPNDPGACLNEVIEVLKKK